MSLRHLFSVLALVGLVACGGSDGPESEPIVIAHRGASGYLPEHTLGGYELAIRLGADYIEPDLQLTQDGVLVAMHDDTLERTTNVADLFAKRNDGYNVADFSLAEIKTLTVHPTGTGKTSYPGFTPKSPEPWRVPTFQEVITLAQSSSSATRTVGIYPEAKQADPVMEDGILQALAKNDYHSDSKVYIQSFSHETLRSMRAKEKAQKNVLPQILLGAAVMGKDGKARMGVFDASFNLVVLEFSDVASFAEGIGLIIEYPDAPLSKDYITQAHGAGLLVHGWTFAQADPKKAAAEYQKYLDMGMDGMFSNYADLAVKARDAFVKSR